MATSDGPKQAFVWTWLPGAVDPVVAGRITQRGGALLADAGGRLGDRVEGGD